MLLSEAENYQKRPTLLNSIRKTIVVHTASIVEAIMLWKLKQEYQLGEVEIDGEWNYKDPHKICTLTDSDEEIIWCKRKLVKKRIDYLDFIHITRLCDKHDIVRGKKLLEDINKIREMRNKIHIGNLSEVDRNYKPEDLEFCFSVLKRVKKIIKDKSLKTTPLLQPKK